MAKLQVMLFVIVLVLALVQIGSSLMCYNCTEAGNKNCKDYFTKSVPIIDCPVGFLCTKHKQPAITIRPIRTDLKPKNLTTNIIRGCKPKDYCSSVEHYSDFCNECADNLCNSSSVVLPSITALLGSLLIIDKLRII